MLILIFEFSPLDHITLNKSGKLQAGSLVLTTAEYRRTGRPGEGVFRPAGKLSHTIDKSSVSEMTISYSEIFSLGLHRPEKGHQCRQYHQATQHISVTKPTLIPTCHKSAERIIMRFSIRSWMCSFLKTFSAYNTYLYCKNKPWFKIYNSIFLSV